MFVFQEKDKKKKKQVEKAASRLKKKAVEQHKHFNQAMKTLRKYRMRAKEGRQLLKCHYVALLEDAGRVKDAHKKKKDVLKNIFWSDPDLFAKYMDHDDLSEDSDGSEDDDDMFDDDETKFGDVDEEEDDDVRACPICVSCVV